MGSKVSTGKMAAVTRVVQAVRPHVPLIKFPNRQEIQKPNVQEALNILENGILQTSASVAAAASPGPRSTASASRLPGTPDSIAVVKDFPQRYRRRELALDEMDYIQRGGPE